jgi:protease I
MARILFTIAESTSSGILDYAYFRMLEEGHEVILAAPVRKPIRTVVIIAGGANGTVDTFQQQPGLIVNADASFDEVDPSACDALVIPGGPGPEYLRADYRCVDIVRHFVENDKPIAAICHGPNLLTEALYAAGIKGKRLSGNVVIEADIVAAGCVWVHTPGKAVVDGNLVTAWRRPDYDVWMGAFVALLEARGIKA